jgi:hypothetical protein
MSNEHHNSWVKDGKPIGMFFFPKEVSFFFGRFGRTRQMSKMLFQTPSWAEYDVKAKRLLIFYRMTGIVCILVFLSPFLLMFFSK